MGNPHPTKSKLCKIGRKHTGAPSIRKSAKIQKAKALKDQEKKILNRKRKKSVAAFWRGEIANFPEQ